MDFRLTGLKVKSCLRILLDGLILWGSQVFTQDKVSNNSTKEKSGHYIEGMAQIHVWYHHFKSQQNLPMK